MSLPNNKLTIVVDNPICANANVENSNASYTNSVPSGGTLILPTQSIQNNGVASGFIPSVGTINVTTNVVPTSFTITGRTIDIVVPSGSSPSGVLFKTIEPEQYTSYRTGDEGWRVQNGFYDYTPPIAPKAVAELDYSIGANYFWKLKDPLIVNGVSSTARFVDVNGVQVFTATGNANLVVIDKLTGMMHTRFGISGFNWNGYIDNALTYSIIVNSITYNDWYLVSKPEFQSLFTQQYAGTPYTDPITSSIIFSMNNQMFTSTTLRTLTSFAFWFDIGGEVFTTSQKTVATYVGRYITNARNLITAP